MSQCYLSFLMYNLIAHDYSANSDVRLKSQNSKADQRSRIRQECSGTIWSTRSLKCNFMPVNCYTSGSFTLSVHNTIFLACFVHCMPFWLKCRVAKLKHASTQTRSMLLFHISISYETCCLSLISTIITFI